MARDQRRLAAIVSADVVGYSRLMGRDESGTLAALKNHRRELIDPKIAEYAGRIVKTTGDGLLLEFSSVVEAVRCAVDVQRGMTERNTSLAPDQRIEFRIGINVGDIIIDGDDIFGDGVNVAARLQTLAEPGAICVSRAARDQVLDKLSFAFEEIGPQQVKNIARPVEVYRIRDKPISATAVQPSPVSENRQSLSRIGPRALWRWFAGAGAVAVVQPRAPASVAGPPLMSVAIMPFMPASAGADDERFANVITQDLTSGTERAMRRALVVSHGRVTKYRDKSFDPRTIGHDLDVRYLVEGEVRNAGEGVAVMARLIETTNGTQVWSARQAGSPSASTMSEGEVVAQLVNRLRIALYYAEEKRVAQLPVAGASAAELVLHADALWDQDPSAKGRVAARKLYEEALGRDPGSTSALLGVFWTTQEQMLNEPGVDHDQLVTEMDDLSSRAVRADRDDPRVWTARARALGWQWQWNGAFEANAAALRIDRIETMRLATGPGC